MLKKNNIYLLPPIVEPQSAGSRMYLDFFSDISIVKKYNKFSKQIISFDDYIIIHHFDLSYIDHINTNNIIVYLNDLIRLDILAKYAFKISLVICTSKIQANIIKSVLSVNALNIFEPIDSFYKNIRFNRDDSTQNNQLQIVIFGYANSIERTHSHLVPALRTVKRNFNITIFSDRLVPSFKNERNVLHRNFSEILDFSSKNFGYAILSDVPVDLSVVTLAKSENKLISSLKMKLLPIISDSDKYIQHLPYNYPYIYSDPNNLVDLLDNKLNLTIDTLYIKKYNDTILDNYNKKYIISKKIIFSKLKLLLDTNIYNIVSYPMNSWPGNNFYSIKDSLNGLKNAIASYLQHNFPFLRSFPNCFKSWRRSR